MSFGKNTEFEIKVENGGEIVHSMKELIPVASKYLNEMKQEWRNMKGAYRVIVETRKVKYDFRIIVSPLEISQYALLTPQI